jgi:isoquinoline 1-oxidoreductase alpha subunit
MSNAAIPLTVNGRRLEYGGDPRQPLLWYLRDELLLTGTKFGCGAAICGACTVHVDGRPERACVLSMGQLQGRSVTTVEGLAGPPGALHAVQRAWIAGNVPQCGYCQSGQMMAAAALLEAKPDPDDAAIDEALAGNLCRCGTYQRIRAAVHHAAALLREQPA